MGLPFGRLVLQDGVLEAAHLVMLRVVILHLVGGTRICIEFTWQHFGDGDEKQRKNGRSGEESKYRFKVEQRVHGFRLGVVVLGVHVSPVLGPPFSDDDGQGYGDMSIVRIFSYIQPLHAGTCCVFVGGAILTKVEEHADEHDEAKPGVEVRDEVDDGDDDVGDGG